MALRHITYRKRQTALAVTAVGLAVGISLLSVAIQNGFSEYMLDVVFKSLPHVTITPTNGENYLHLYQNVMDNVWSLEGVVGVSPVIAASAAFTHEEKVVNAAMLGILPSEADKINSLGENMVQGDLSSITAGKRILLGRALADKLNLRMGDTVKASFPDAKDIDLTVSGIFDTGYASVDERTSYVSLVTAQEFLDEGNVVTKIEIKLNDIYNAKAVSELLSSNRYKVQVWQDANPEIEKTLAFEKRSNIITLLLILVIATFGIASIMNMLVLEKTKEIGMLIAIGAERSQIRKIFLLESGLLGLLGAMLGCILSILLATSLRTLQVEMPTGGMVDLPIILTLQDLITFSMIAMILSLIAGVYPAHTASKLDPVESLKG
ncbi:MAG: ABC transporter permease [Methanothrix sp.]|nr:ABC transporter permease [Methanothrix sp.]